MQLLNIRMWVALVGYLALHSEAYALQGWPMYPQAPREYQDEDYYYNPKEQYYYENPTVNEPETYGQVAYPHINYPYGHFVNEDSKRQEERFAALPIGQETWFESDASPRWQSNDLDDVSAAFLDNLILTQMAQDAQRRRENNRAAFPVVDYEEKNVEDEDVRELKALAGQPLYHVPKTVPKIEEDEDDYQNDDSFINWNSNKRSGMTPAPMLSTSKPKAGQLEIMVPRPMQTNGGQNDEGKRQLFYGKLGELKSYLENHKEPRNTHAEILAKPRKMNKRFVAGDSDLVLELRGLKHRIPT